ncbi:MAG TPA: hypothetical protein VH416_03175 [Gaiellaceae bacterium]|jgi:hypothetical protein
MATTDGTPLGTEELRIRIRAEREQLARAVENLRADIDDAKDVKSKLRRHLPLATGSALGLGFVAAGGIGATVRLLRGGD